jgi:aspartate kinase
MALWVQKFGGSSLGSIARLQHVAQIIAASLREKHQVVVVVSAMGDDTEDLLSLAKSAAGGGMAHGSALDALLACGEQKSAALLALVLQKLGIATRVVSGADIGIFTDQCYQNAQIKHVDVSRIHSYLDRGLLPIVTGFQAIGSEGLLTTLGRGGSDATAVALGSALVVDECQIYTDVSGLYTADPKAVKEAQLLKRITFAEMMELSSSGAKILQAKAVAAAGQYNVPIRLLSSFEKGVGTLISYEDPLMEGSGIRGLSHEEAQVLVKISNVPMQSNVLSAIMTQLNAVGVRLDMLSQLSQSGCSMVMFVLSEEELPMVVAILQKLQLQFAELSFECSAAKAKIAMIGAGLGQCPDIVQRVYGILAEEKVEVHMLQTSELRLTILIDDQHWRRVLACLHQRFILEKKKSLASSLVSA